MMRKFLAIGMTIGMAGVLVACGSSPPARFISLEPTPADERIAVSGPPLGVAQVNLPPALDRRALVVRTGSARLEVRGTERWAGPLEVMARRTLALDLDLRIEGAEVILPGLPKPSESMQLVSVALQTFSAGPGNEVLLEGHWSLLRGEPRQVVLRRQEKIRIPSHSATAADIAAAMSQALGRLADRIARTLAEQPTRE